MTQLSTSVLRFSALRRSSYSRSLVIRGLNAILALAVSVLFARLLGPANYGKYGILLAFATLLAIPLSAGLPRTLTRDIAIARMEDDAGRIRRLIKFGSLAFLGITPIVGLIATGLWYSGYKIAGIAAGALLCGLLAPMLAAESNRIAAMRGLGSALKSQVPDMVVRPVATGLIVIVLTVAVGSASAEAGVFAYALASLVGFVAGVLLMSRDLRTYPNVPPKRPLAKKAFLASIVTMSFLGGSKVLTGNVDMLLVNHYATYSQAGQYKVALTGLALVIMGAQAVIVVAYTRLAEAVTTADKRKISTISDKALILNIGLTGLLTILVLVVGRPAIMLIYGNDYSGAWYVLLLLSAGFTLAYAFGPGDDIASLTGSQVAAAGCVLGGIAATLVIAALLAPAWGFLGIAIGSMVGTIGRHVLLSLLIFKRVGINITLVGALSRRFGRKVPS